MNQRYAFDVMFFASITVDAGSEKEAREVLAAQLQTAQFVVAGKPVAFSTDDSILYAIDGEAA